MPSDKDMPKQTDSAGKQTSRLVPPDPNPGEPFYYAARPNQMTYVDGSKKERTICVKGRSQEAGKLLVEENWDALARFPEWSGSPEQQYQPEDYTKLPKEQSKA
ncbi:hypothetical protein LTR37_017211 [Vermiconidia calcicola]|uniref:Uncharacterized protein n=1 Tax=Vermiconidia calcicola TaxID=1690605 RepID=A0ACC3MM72_9PEZI|nr:hypothetical protein LTR37_017211 [Vermiconidia calcicola]